MAWVLSIAGKGVEVMGEGEEGGGSVAVRAVGLIRCGVRVVYGSRMVGRFSFWYGGYERGWGESLEEKGRPLRGGALPLYDRKKVVLAKC
ncbi:hypothetical protein E2C01_064615 [Portunus trituberculatus]|uniref:Uncharacterized protein n=1 Tax=Portunus trituberculatus TaxID=210409 RepID=A0A5B7HKU6_PORTR|nr:hypothetical protein [Portunus trituberculatus]